MPEIIKNLTKVYPKLKLSQFIVQLLTRTLESCELPSQKILTETIHSTLFTDPQCRRLLVPIIQTSLTHVFTSKLDKVILCLPRKIKYFYPLPVRVCVRERVVISTF